MPDSCRGSCNFSHSALPEVHHHHQQDLLLRVQEVNYSTQEAKRPESTPPTTPHPSLTDLYPLQHALADNLPHNTHTRVPTVVVVLQGLQHAGRFASPQLGQPATGGAQLRAQVGHLLAGRLDGPVDALGQLLVVVHHLQDLRLPSRREPARGVMPTS